MKKVINQKNKNAATLAIIGCGAITETFYMPAFNKYPEMLENLILVDKNLEQAKKLADKFLIKKISSDYTEVINSVDGAIIAVPHHLHFPITKYFLEHGVHVLCEKPLTENSTEARELIQLSEKNNVTLSVNLTRRLMPSSGKIKELLNAGAIGKLSSITYLDGSEFNWPTASGFYFDSKISKKGVLLDIGSHVFDLICWWLGGKPSVVCSENDSFGGCEAVASVSLDYHGVSVSIRLSRLHRLPNSYRIVGERGSIEGMVYNGNFLLVKNDKESKKLKLYPEQVGMDDFGLKLVGNFTDVVMNNACPLISAHEVLDSIELLEEAYNKTKKFSLPWYNLREKTHAG